MPILDQGVNLFRFALAFAILFYVAAPLLFREEGERGEVFFARWVKMNLLIIIAGYALVMLKLFELLSLLILLLAYGIFRRLPRGGRRNHVKESLGQGMVFIYEVMDGHINPLSRLRDKTDPFRQELLSRLKGFLGDPSRLILLVILAGAAYLRFADPLRHAAPGLSDSGVTLAWMKYIDGRILFHDGIYSQGFHIYLATLRKFTGSDALYVLKYAGPWNGVLTTLSIYYLTKVLSGRKSAGLVAAFVYGILGPFLPQGWERQAATNSQEFALTFLAPAWLFTVRYLETLEKRYRLTAFAAYGVTGLVHPLIFAYMAYGVFFILIAYLLTSPRRSWPGSLNTLISGVLAGALALLPYLIGWLMGRPFHSSSVAYLSEAALPELVVITALKPLDLAALAGLGLLILILLWPSRRQTPPEPLLFSGLLTFFSFLAYRYLVYLTGSALIMNRIVVLWSIVISLALGMGWYALMKLVPLLKPHREAYLLLVLLLGTAVYLRPQPAEPYKMLYDSMVNQYIQITKEYQPTTWTLVSNEEGYYLVLGVGYHIQMANFNEQYRYDTQWITRQPDGNQILQSEDIFLVIHKHILLPPVAEMKAIVQQRQKNYRRLQEWVDGFSRYHNNIAVYYEDENLVIYHIHQDLKKELDKVWNNNR